MPERAAIASVSGLTVGVAATAAITGGPESETSDVVLMTAVWVAAMVCVTVVAMATLRRWLSSHDERTHQMARQIALERSTFIEASATRARELNEREERLNKQAEQVSTYVMGIARRLDEALTRNTHLERELADLATRYEELARDHTELVREILQERADRFRRRMVTTHAVRKATVPCPPPQVPQGDTPVRPYADPHGGHHPVAPIPLRRMPPPALLADHAQHERSAEGARGPA